MAGHFKKRRGPQGPNKNEQKVFRAQSAQTEARRGVLGSRFSTVKHLRVKLSFVDARQTVLDEKIWEFGPSDAAPLTVACPGRCGHGSFDFASILGAAVEARLGTAQGSAKCPESLSAGSADACGCEAKVQMEIEYFPDPVANS